MGGLFSAKFCEIVWPWARLPYGKQGWKVVILYLVWVAVPVPVNNWRGQTHICGLQWFHVGWMDATGMDPWDSWAEIWPEELQNTMVWSPVWERTCALWPRPWCWWPGRLLLFSLQSSSLHSLSSPTLALRYCLYFQKSFFRCISLEPTPVSPLSNNHHHRW